jgi:tetratricopeptide (TPR) repeat protein
LKTFLKTQIETNKLFDMTEMKKKFGIIAIAILSLNIAKAQTQAEAAACYNRSIGLMTADVNAAIVTIDSCITMCTTINDSASNALKEKANSFRCDLLNSKATKLFTVEKNVNGAIAAAKEASTMADKCNNTKAKEKAQKFLPQAYSSMGANFFKNKDFANAIKAFDSALAINPNYSKAIFNKALAYKGLNDATNFGTTIDLYIEKITAENDTVQLAAAKKQALEFYRGAGSKANQGNKLPDAITLLTTAQKYGVDKDVYYYLADVFNKQKKFDDALTNAQKGLDMETGTPEAKAKFYWALGTAQLGKGDKASACGSFKNSMFGPFLEPSKAQIANNKCNEIK